jgi:glycosyltransferase involved in cell wall biosynthesis
LCRVPHVVFTCHAFASRDYQPAWRKRAYLAIERAMDRYTDRYFASSNAIRELLVSKRIARAERVTVIPQGIDLPPPPTPQARQAAREALAADPDDLVVVWAGRLEEQKGLIHLLRAWPGVITALPRARLVLLGDGPLRGFLQAQAGRLGIAGTVQFLGWRNDVAALMPGADVFCLPSLWESFGYVLLEAMAAGVPVVASAVEGIPEVVGDHCGILVPPADPPRLTDALVEALRDSARRETMARAARQRVEREFTVGQMVSRFEDAYDSLLQ